MGRSLAAWPARLDTSLRPRHVTVLALALYRVVPNAIVAVGMLLACVAIYLMAE